jgi:ferritin-like metal-binding protein YciE
MPTVTPKYVLRHELGRIYEEHRQVLPILDRLETQTGRASIRDRLRRHREETLNQIENMHHCFELLGTDAPRVECAVVRALDSEALRFEEQSPGPWAVDLHNLLAAMKMEHLEWASYRGTLELAAATGHDDVQRLLGQNFTYVESMLQWLELELGSLVSELDLRVAAIPR